MKYLLIPLALVACNAMACPGDNPKDAMAPAVNKPLVAVKSATPAPAAVSKKTSSKLAVKSSTEARKTGPL